MTSLMNKKYLWKEPFQWNYFRGSKANIDIRCAPQNHVILICPNKENISSQGHSKFIFLSNISYIKYNRSDEYSKQRHWFQQYASWVVSGKAVSTPKERKRCITNILNIVYIQWWKLYSHLSQEMLSKSILILKLSKNVM